MPRNDLVNKNWLANSFCNFRKRNGSPENVVRPVACKYHKSCRNNQFKKILELEREQAKKGPENPAKIAKVTRIFLAT